VCKSEEVSFPFAERDLHWPVPADFLSSRVTNTKITALSQAVLQHMYTSLQPILVQSLLASARVMAALVCLPMKQGIIL
jgi:hypothetical protein